MTETLRWQYHVPRSQVWGGSRGRQTGRVHLHINGRPACRPKTVPWYPRDPIDGEQRCGRCVAIWNRRIADALAAHNLTPGVMTGEENDR